MAAVASLTNLIACLSPREASASSHAWIDKGELLIGNYPKASFQYDFASEKMIFVGKISGTGTDQAKRRESLVHLAKRSSGGRYEIETDDTIYTLGSATHALTWGLEYIEDKKPGTLDKLAEVKGRSKRPVSRNLNDLYDLPSQRRYSEKLNTGHYVATNNKALESLGFVRRAAMLAGLSKDSFTIRRVGR